MKVLEFLSPKLTWRFPVVRQSSIAGDGQDPILLFALVAAVCTGVVLIGHFVLRLSLRRNRSNR
ncbi:MAG: hypothetical protein MUC36_17440 [Planctomycetes bacterium]|jgi:hypothetical protein|nr:hypothetical protein [Planctomycetota bacterium]